MENIQNSIKSTKNYILENLKKKINFRKKIAKSLQKLLTQIIVWYIFIFTTPQ